MEIFLPGQIRSHIEGLSYYEEEIGQSDSHVWMFDDFVLKIEKQSTLTERQNRMLHWLEGKLPVPRIICSEEADGMQYLLMTRIHGEMTCADENMLKPVETVCAVADALKLLWKVDITDCPVVYTFDQMLADAAQRLPQIDRGSWQGHFPTPEEQLAWLTEHKPKEDFVFAHGDFCMPNVMLEKGHVSGFIDLGQCGAADRWYDIALMMQSMERNFGGFFGGHPYEGYEPDVFLEKLGIQPDREKLHYHLLLDELY